MKAPKTDRRESDGARRNRRAIHTQRCKRRYWWICFYYFEHGMSKIGIADKLDLDPALIGRIVRDPGRWGYFP